MRTLVETGVLVGERGASRLAQPLESLQVPATVQAILAARIDRLPPEDKRLLQTAAVIGTEIPFALLQAVAELSEATLQRGLAHVQAAEFLYETHLFPDLAYTFKHALTHEVAYSGLLQERRRMLHARIVAASERLYVDRLAEQAERLAQHAYRGEVWEKALAYCRQAGEKAMARSAYREAVGYFEQTLSALRHLPETRDTREQAVDLQLALHSALNPLGDFERFLACLHEAEALAVALDDPRRLGQVSRFLSQHFYFRGAYDQSMATGQRALVLATSERRWRPAGAGNPASRPRLPCYGRISSGDRLLQAGAGVSRWGAAPRALGSNRHACRAPCAMLAWCHAELGTFTEGRAPGDEGIRIAEVMRRPGSFMVASWGVGLLASTPRRPARGLPRLERAMGICQEADLPVYFPWMARGSGCGVYSGWAHCRCCAAAHAGDGTDDCHGNGRRSDTMSSPLGEAHLRLAVLEEARAPAGGYAGASPMRTSNRVSRRMPCASSATSPRIVLPRPSTRPQPTTARPSPWLTNSACARSRRTAAGAWACCMRRRGRREQAYAELTAAIDLSRVDGDDLLVATDGGGAGAGERR